MSRSRKDIQPHWRPNFVNAAELPDIKAVRTGFLINFVAVVLMLLAGFYVLQREYRAFSLSNEIEDMEQRIRVAGPEDAASLKLSREFRDLAAHVSELELFYASPVLAHDLLTELAKIRPENLIFKRLSLIEMLEKVDKADVITYRINIVGEVQSLTVLDDFKVQLASWDLLRFEGYEVDIDEALQGRDAVTGIFPYTLEISLKPAKKKKPDEEEGDQA